MKLIKRFLMVIVALTIFVATTATITKVNAVEKTFTVIFKDTNTSNDSSTALKNAADVSEFVESGTEYISGISSISRVYKGKTGCGLKFGSSSGAGSLSLNLNSEYDITKISINALQFGSDTSKIKCGFDPATTDTSNVVLSSTESECLFNLTGKSSKITIATSEKRAYIKSFSVTYIEKADYTVTYDYNDGTGNKAVLTLAEGASISENAPKNLTRVGYKHIGWSNASDSTTVLEGFDDLTVSASATYYAVWQATETKNLTLNANGGNFSSETTTVNPYEKGTTITLSELTTPEYDANHVFEGWSYTLNGAVIADTTITLNEDTTLFAVWHEYTALEKVKSLDVTNSAQSNLKFSYTETTVPAEKEGWFLVTDASDLKVGDKVVIAAKDSSVAMSTTQNGNNRGEAAITVSNNELTINDKVQQLTLEIGSIDNTFAFNTGTGYLYAASSSKNYLKTQKNVDGNASFSITIGSDGVATIKASGSNTNNLLKYNTGSKLFSCYASGQSDVVLYKLVSETKSYEVETMTLNVRVSMDKADYEYIMAKDSDSVFAFDVTVSGVNKNVEITKFSEEDDKVVFYLSINNIPTDKFALEFAIDLYYLGNDGSHSLSLGNFSVIKTVNKYIAAPNDVINEHMGVLKYISTLN